MQIDAISLRLNYAFSNITFPDYVIYVTNLSVLNNSEI